MTSTNQLRTTMNACRNAFLWLALFSGCVNLLMLTAPLYMLQVFDRVLASRSTDTLLLLSLIAGFALLALAGLEGVRSFPSSKSVPGWIINSVQRCSKRVWRTPSKRAVNPPYRVCVI